MRKITFMLMMIILVSVVVGFPTPPPPSPWLRVNSTSMSCEEMQQEITALEREIAQKDRQIELKLKNAQFKVHDDRNAFFGTCEMTQTSLGIGNTCAQRCSSIGKRCFFGVRIAIWYQGVSDKLFFSCYEKEFQIEDHVPFTTCLCC